VTNPSGHLPITIERQFEDSPGADYLPAGEKLYSGWKNDGDMRHPVYPINYKEGVFVGYRWYEAKHIAPLYAFGSGLSYTTFSLAEPKISAAKVKRGSDVTVTVAVTNTGKVAGTETVQVYVHPADAPVARPEKELKGFARVTLAPGETRNVTVTLGRDAFAYWDTSEHGWTLAPGEYGVLVGSASDRITGQASVTLE
jgi:beta-glucosidase